MLKSILPSFLFLFIFSCDNNNQASSHSSFFIEGNSMTASVNGEQIIFDSVFGFYQYWDVVTNASDDGQNYFRIKGFNRERNIAIGFDVYGGLGNRYYVRHAALLLNNELYVTVYDGPELGYTNNHLNDCLDLSYDEPNMPSRSDDPLYIDTFFVDEFHKGGHLWNDNVNGHFSFKINKRHYTIQIAQGRFAIQNLIPGTADIQRLVSKGFTLDEIKQ